MWDFWNDCKVLFIAILAMNIFQLVIFEGVLWVKRNCTPIFYLLLHYVSVFVWIGVFVYLVGKVLPLLSVFDVMVGSLESYRVWVSVTVVVIIGFPYYLAWSGKLREVTRPVI
ncbi:MAG: hypothetical protein HWE25_10115 [Alphaproteobacteria bacterium]|nr:hypothetical protein [Alphaproteobacteria bacterium]